MTRTITWRGIIAHIGVGGIDGRKLDTLKFDRLPVPVYWFNNVYDIHNRHTRHFQHLGRVVEAQIVRMFGGSKGYVKAVLELDTNTLPCSNETLWPEIDLGYDLDQLVAICLGTKPIWRVDPVIVVAQP